jgi:hypothetical protein
MMPVRKRFANEAFFEHIVDVGFEGLLLGVGETIDSLEGWHGVHFEVDDEIVRSMFWKGFSTFFGEDIDVGMIVLRDDGSRFC